MKTITVRDARANFSDLLNEVHFGKRQIVITRSGKPFVILTSTKSSNVKREKRRRKKRNTNNA